MAYAVVASAALAAGTVGLSPTAGAAPGGHQLPGSVASWANAAHKVGQTKASTHVTFRVYQNWRGGDAAQQFAMSASTPGTADYGHFLSPRQFRARYSPSRADTQAVAHWLRSQGFKVTGIPANRKYVQARGTLRQASRTFQTGFARYRVDGQTVRSNTRPLTIPRSMAARVQAVVGLDTSQTLARTDRAAAPPPAAFVNAPPCSMYWGEKHVDDTSTANGAELPDSPNYAFAPCGYTPPQLQGAYGLASTIANGTDGTGVTVGVIDAYASGTIVRDVNQYFENQYADAPKLVEGKNFRQVVPHGVFNRPENPAQFPQEWSGEETLDIEAVHAMAPGADIVYIGAPNNYRDMDAIMNRVVDKHLADIVTNSYGYAGEALPPGYIKPQLDTQIQAMAEGISLLFSSGDSGDETGGNHDATPTPDWPASSPFVTAVGGTSLGVDENKARVFELGWETSKKCLTDDDNTCPESLNPPQPSPKTGHWSDPVYQYGSGGGTSRLFAQPSYQAGVVPNSLSQTYGGAPMRVVPDVSAVGDPTTGMLVGQTQTFPDGTSKYSEYRIGGTSLSSPLYAGMLALVEQSTGELGLANPVLYKAQDSTFDITTEKLGDYPGAVRADFFNSVNGHDGYLYSVRLFDSDGQLTIHVQGGYDDVTGIGSPDGTSWLDQVVCTANDDCPTS